MSRLVRVIVPFRNQGAAAFLRWARPFIRLWHHYESADFPYKTVAGASKLGTYHIQHYKFRRNAPPHR